MLDGNNGQRTEFSVAFRLPFIPLRQASLQRGSLTLKNSDSSLLFLCSKKDSGMESNGHFAMMFCLSDFCEFFWLLLHKDARLSKIM